ncbi:cytochrome C assembly family protein [Glaciecola sp. 2405UD65-10]|uniref:cytochrome C assembly family protein n=1 Tax=Glaciecola sp. 2405UD65-10 TaxID=3397244 RepID=UPI003B5969F5
MFSTQACIFAFAIIGYVAAGVLYAKQFFSHSNKLAKYAQLSLMLGLISHLGLLILQTSNSNGEQLSLSFVTAMLAWLVTLTIFITHKFIKNLLFIPVVCFVSALFISIDMLVPATTGITVNMSLPMILHILLSLMAFGVLSISTLYACQLAYINYQLKHKKRIMLSGTLPPLMAVENILYKLMTYGSILLFVALATGFIFVENMLADGYGHKTVLSSLSLVCFVACIVLHKIFGLRARVAITLNIIGLSLLALGYFGSRLVKELLLN